MGIDTVEGYVTEVKEKRNTQGENKVDATYLIREYVKEIRIMSFKAPNKEVAQEWVDKLQEGEIDWEELPGYSYIRTKGNTEIDGPEILES
jgi:hypothetical protein